MSQEKLLCVHCRSTRKKISSSSSQRISAPGTACCCGEQPTLALCCTWTPTTGRAPMPCCGVPRNGRFVLPLHCPPVLSCSPHCPAVHHRNFCVLACQLVSIPYTAKTPDVHLVLGKNLAACITHKDIAQWLAHHAGE